MPGFYIKKVTANSAKKGDASVTFGKGLNIIQGRSDSGKTCVANCIDFIYGGQTSKPFKDSAQYDGVTMIVAAMMSREMSRCGVPLARTRWRLTARSLGLKAVSMMSR